MGKSLVIVESPAKAKTINKYLGKSFIVRSSIGHIRDLPVSGAGNRKPLDAKARAKAAAQTRKLSAEDKIIHKKKKSQAQLISRMGIDPNNHWTPHYEILPGKEKVVDELRRLAKDADTVYLATDLDREGEAIAWHLQEAIGESVAKYQRVTFNEITKKAIQEAFSQPSTLNMDRVNAQQARRFLDRVVGYMVSPLLWAKIARGLSAGRVQSVAVRLIVERERDIRKFIPEEYWEIFADLLSNDHPVRFDVTKQHGKAFKPTNETEANAALEQLKKVTYVIDKYESKPTETRPSAPFITSTLQQAASTRLGFGVKKTMMLAQRLYEAGFITYMRTDSTSLSQESIANVREYISEEFSNKYLPEKPNFYASKNQAQEAHEAVRPSDVTRKPSAISGLDRDAQRLYDLIWKQFVACQMVPARYLSSTVTVAAGDFELKAKGRVMEFDGFTRIQQSGKKGSDVTLPSGMEKGQTLTLKKLDPKQLFTRPPARFTEAALVKELEKQGIGRPSTYASIISTIQDRGYASVQQRRFYAEKIGDIVTDRLTENFSNLMDFSFTARMEKRLDEVAEGETNWLALLDGFYKDFSARLEKAEAEQGMRTNQPVETDITCTKCNRPMQIRTASTGVFLGCSGYALPPKERCKETINLVPGDEIAADDEFAEVNALLAKHRCNKCGTAMDSYLIDEKRKLHICGNNPDCLGFEIENGTFKIKGYEGPTLECDKCQSEMQLKSGRFGKYFGCTNSECKNTRKLLKNGQPAPPKMDPVPMPELQCTKVDDHYILRDGASGLFLAASKFPRNRETRAPLVKELIPHKAAIDSKYHYLLTGPVKDSDGNDSIIRFSRKTQQQYLMSEVAGKATGWQAYFSRGVWEERVTKGRGTAKKGKK